MSQVSDYQRPETWALMWDFGEEDYASDQRGGIWL